MKTIDLEWVSKERDRLDIQMYAHEVFFIARSITPPVNFLIFGMGNDSIFWSELNRGGRTAFIEDQPDWFDQISREHSSLEGYLVEYGTKLEEARRLINHPDWLAMDLPPAVRNTQWDVILVDAPAGYENGTPGRMKSIFEASRLIKQGGSIFVHDQERDVEKEYCERYLSQGRAVAETSGRALLRHYKY
jgi:Polysaccharide biosynthesis